MPKVEHSQPLTSSPVELSSGNKYTSRRLIHVAVQSEGFNEIQNKYANDWASGEIVLGIQLLTKKNLRSRIQMYICMRAFRAPVGSFLWLLDAV